MVKDKDNKPDNAKKENYSESNGRRNFLKNAGFIGVGVFAGSLSKYFTKKINKNSTERKDIKDLGLKTGI